MPSTAPTQQEQARAAYDGGAWERSLALFRDAESSGVALPPEDLERMGFAAWLIGEPAHDILGRACDDYEAAGQVHDAVRIATNLADYHGLIGESSKAMGWGRRAGRMLETASPGAGHARVALLQGFLAVLSGRGAAALEHVEKAHSLACEHGDGDAEALALSRRAALLLRLGRVDEASADVDEAMLLVHRGRAHPVSGAMIYCNTIDFCRDLGDFERALEWTEAATRWTTERQVCGFPGICRVHHAELLRMQGQHGEAEAQVRSAIEVFQRHRFRFGMGHAMGEIGLQRLEVGDLDGAQDAFDQAVELGHEPLPGAAVLALRRGDAAGARAMLETALEERSDNPLGRARLLPALVSACIELDDHTAARSAATELRDIARRIGTVGTQAHAETASARVSLASGNWSDAIRSARAAARAWNLLGACYEQAQARELLAEAYQAAGDNARARVELQRVRTTREALSTAPTMLADPPPAVPVPRAPPRPIANALPVHEGLTLDGKIEIGPVLGIGGMGIVHAGRHLITGRDVAVKVLKRSACGASEQCARFLREAMACGRIRHPNVVDIYDAGMWGDEPYIVMERLDGHCLEQVLEGGATLAVAEALTICEQAARGVAAAHAAGIVHRDLKPANIFVSERGVKVLDFGISKQPEGGGTRPGALMGTPFYMAPEQITQPDTVDARTDVYALGVVLFEVLAGHPPFIADAVHAVLHAILNGAPPELRRHAPDVPSAVDAIVRRAVARNPRERFDSAAAFADAIVAARAGL